MYITFIKLTSHSSNILYVSKKKYSRYDIKRRNLKLKMSKLLLVNHIKNRKKQIFLTHYATITKLSPPRPKSQKKIHANLITRLAIKQTQCYRIKTASY